jgi:hypothetical protein
MNTHHIPHPVHNFPSPIDTRGNDRDEISAVRTMYSDFASILLPIGKPQFALIWPRLYVCEQSVWMVKSL